MKQLELYIIKILQFLYALYNWLTKTNNNKNDNHKKETKHKINK